MSVIVRCAERSTIHVATQPPMCYGSHMDGKTKLRNWRKAEGITQEKAADILGVSVRTYQNWEIGTFAPSLEMAARVHAVSGIPTTDWIDSAGKSSDWVAP